MNALLAFVRELKKSLVAPQPDDYACGYHAGYLDALNIFEEEILEVLWEEGEDGEST